MRRDKRTNRLISVPCSNCPECLGRRASGWSVRLMMEERHCTSAFFITLTYANNNLRLSGNGHYTCRKDDLQKFFKRLRKAHSSKKRNPAYFQQPLKYYAVQEYGGRFKRPHYHVILFNARVQDVELAWTLGHVHFGSVNELSVGYTLGYLKKAKMSKVKNDDREVARSFMSKGLGLCYFTEKMAQWHAKDLVNNSYVLVNGVKRGLPRYYRDKLYLPGERELMSDRTFLRQYFANLKEYTLWRKKVDSRDRNTYERVCYNTKKGFYDKNKIQASIECARVSKALFCKHTCVKNSSGPGDVYSNNTREVHARPPFAQHKWVLR